MHWCPQLNVYILKWSLHLGYLHDHAIIVSPFYVAYLLVHSLACLSWSSLLDRYWVAILPTKGSAEIENEEICCTQYNEKRGWIWESSTVIVKYSFTINLFPFISQACRPWFWRKTICVVWNILVTGCAIHDQRLAALVFSPSFPAPLSHQG